MTEWMDELLAKLRERFPPESDPADVEAYLASEGYDRREIGEILTRLFSHVGASADGAAPSPGSFRVLGLDERGRFDPEAWGQLLALRQGGLLDSAELEQVIERMLTNFDGPIALDDLRAFMRSAGVGDPASAGQMTVH